MNALVNEWINGGLHWAIRLCRFLLLVGFLANRKQTPIVGKTENQWIPFTLFVGDERVASSSLFHFSFDIPQSSCVSVEQVVHDGICAHRPTAFLSTTTKMWPDKSDGRSKFFLFISVNWMGRPNNRFIWKYLEYVAPYECECAWNHLKKCRLVGWFLSHRRARVWRGQNVWANAQGNASDAVMVLCLFCRRIPHGLRHVRYRYSVTATTYT